MKLIPADKQQCQAEYQIGAFSFGGQIGKRVRCINKPTVIVKERKVAADGLIGSMSLCDACLQNAYKQLGNDFFTVTKIAAQNKRSGAAQRPTHAGTPRPKRRSARA